MALHLISCFHSFKLQINATKSQFSKKFHHVKFDSLSTANKWNISQENHSIAWINSHLNIDYHFHEEIDAFLHRQYVISTTCWGTYDNDLHHIALCFRLFRQQGYYVPAEVFDKFTDKKGKFKQKVGGNIKGMIDLYEASQLSIRGEDILDEAGQFSGLVLKEKLGCLDDHEAKSVRKTLEVARMHGYWVP